MILVEFPSPHCHSSFFLSFFYGYGLALLLPVADPPSSKTSELVNFFQWLQLGGLAVRSLEGKKFKFNRLITKYALEVLHHTLLEY